MKRTAKGTFYTAGFDLLQGELRQLRREVEGAAGLNAYEGQNVIKSALYNVGAEVAKGLNTLIAQRIPNSNQFTRNAFRIQRVGKHTVNLYAQKRQGSYLQFLLDADPSRRDRDEKKSELLSFGPDYRFVPAKAFGETETTQAKRRWQYMLEQSAANRQAKSGKSLYFYGRPKAGGPAAIYRRSNNNTSLVPVAWELEETNYGLVFDFEAEAQKLFNEHAEKGVREALEFRIRKLAEKKAEKDARKGTK